MKYALDRMLPLRAFQGRGTPIGGRSVRLWGYTESGDWIATGDEVSDPRLAAVTEDAAYQAAMAAWNTPAPAPAAAAAPLAAPDPAPSWSPPSEAAPAPLAAAQDWTQTVNDIFQQELNRQADASGMSTFTDLLNQGWTGEQVRNAIRNSEEYKNAHAAAAPVAPLTAAATAAPVAAQWEWQAPESVDATTLPGYWRDVISGNRKEAAPVEYAGVTPVDTNTLPIQTALNYEGTPTQFYDAQGNLKGVLVDTVRAGLGAKEGSLILDPASLGLALKPGETPSIDSAIQQRNEQGQMLYIDPTTGGTTIYNTGVPALSGSTVKDLMYINDPGKRGGQIPADTIQAALIAAAIATGGALAPELLGAEGALASATAGELGFAGAAGAGAGAAGAGAGLTAAEAATLMGGTLSDAGAASTLGGTVADAGVNWGAAATAATKSAAINAAVTAAQGGSPTDILKAGALGAVTGGAGVAGADLLGGGALAQIGSQTAVATAIAAATGKDPVQAALSGALTATVANIIPAGTTDVLNAAGITDPSIQKAVNTAISSSVITAIRGGDIGTAAIMGAVNSGLASVAGMIGNSQVVQDLKASLKETISSAIDSIKYETGATNAQALPVEGSNKSPVGTPLDTTTQPDVVNNILQQDVQGVMDRNAPPPLVQNAIDQNTPKTIDNVVTPPLIAQATGQSDPNAIYEQLVANAANPTVGAPLASTASAVTSDVNSIYLPSGTGVVNISGSGDEALAKYNQVLSAYGYSPVTMDDPEYRQWAAQYLEAQANKLPLGGEGSYNPNAPLDSGFKPQLPKESYDPAITALQKEGLNVTYGTLDQFAQDPGALVDAVYPALAGRQPTAQERINFIDQYSNSNTTSPQDLLKDIYDQIQMDKQVPVYIDQQTPITQTPVTPTPPLATPVEPVKAPAAPAAPAAPEVSNVGGQGTDGAAAAGNEGAPGAVAAAAPLTAAQATAQASAITEQAASSNDIATVDIPIDTQRLVSNSAALGTSPAQAVASGLVNPDGSLTAKGIQQISDATGLSPSDVVALTNGATTAKTGTGSGVTSTGAGATTGTASGAAVSGTGIGGSTGTGVGGLGNGTGTGTGDGTGSGGGLGGTGTGTGTGGTGTGTGSGVKTTAPATTTTPSYMYGNASSQGTTVGALPGNLQGTFLQGVNVNEYNPFENYDVYQQLAPVHAAQGGSPLQLAQMQQGISGVDPSLYSVLQKRQAPSYFTYGQDASGGNPTTFAGSQLLGKPTPGIPVIPTGKASSSDWLYQGSGTNPLAMAGTGIPSLGAGTMAEGGSAHGGGEGEHIPEFITGATGHYVRGGGDGQSDDIPAMLADGEYVFDASTVSTLGNGSSDAGAKLLDAFRESLRGHTRSAPADKIPPKASPLEYMKEALQHVGRK